MLDVRGDDIGIWIGSADYQIPFRPFLPNLRTVLRYA